MISANDRRHDRARQTSRRQPPGTAQDSAPARHSSAPRRPSSPPARLNVPVLEITQAADVGMGSFYNHFDSKEELFEAGGQRGARRTTARYSTSSPATIDDPAETFARSFRLTGRLFRRRPEMSRVLLNNGLTLISVRPRPRAAGPARHQVAATRAGRFTVDDPGSALAVAGGALMGLGQLLHDQPERDDAEAADRVTERRADHVRLACRRGRGDLPSTAA